MTYAYQYQLNEFKEFNQYKEDVFSSNQNLHQYGFMFQRPLLTKEKFQLLGGLGYSRQQILGYIGVNTSYGTNFLGSVLTIRKNYTIQLAEVPVTIRFPINKTFDFDLSITPQFRFHQNMDYDIQAKFRVALNAIEIYPAISYQYNDYRFSLGGRLLNWQMFDRLFYYHDYPNNNPNFYEQTLYRYNPLKLRFVASYAF